MKTTASRLILVGSTLLLATLVALTVFAQADGQGLVRFVHVIAGADAIDVYTDGQLTIDNLEPGGVSGFIAMQPGAHTVTVTEADSTTVLWEQTINPAANTAQTLVAATSEPLEFQVFQDDLAPLRPGSTRFTAIHALPDGPVVDVILSDGRPVVSGLNYGQIYGTLDIPAMSYELAVVPSGEGLDSAIVAATPYGLHAGISHILLIHGSADAPQATLLNAPAQAQDAAGFVRVIHAIPGGDPVDVALDGTGFASGVAFGGEVAPFAAVASGDHTVSVRVAGSDTELVTGDVTVGAGEYVTIAVAPAGGAPVLHTFTSDLSGIAADHALVNVINLLTGDATASVTLDDGAEVASGVAAGASSTGAISPVASGATVSIVAGEETTEIAAPLDAFYGGVLYEIVITEGESGPEVFVAKPASIAQGVASAPGNEMLADAVSETSEIVADADIPVAEESEVVLTEPAVAPTEPAPAPSSTEEPLPTARVLLDPGANLQLRQYPSSQAFSLGLAPAGAVLTVHGRQGPAELSVFETPSPEATEWVDPVTLLGEREDLPRLETWLYVTYNTPDGGQIQAWVNSHYVSVHLPNGDILPLRNLITIPSNRPGVARDTAITAPQPTQPTISAIVGGLDEGVNLQIRRTPDIAGESLTLVPNGTELELIGMNEARSWAFVRFIEADGGTVTGWVNALFLVDYLYQNRDITFAQLEERGLIDTIEESQRGRVAGEVSVPPTPTRDPLRNTYVGTVMLDPGANLQLRRNPNINAESLGLIPAGEQVEVSGRTEAGDWLQVTYDGIQGWSAAAYLRLTFNGRPANVAELPVVEAGQTTPPAGPEGTAEPGAPVAPAGPDTTAAPSQALRPAEIVVDVIAMTVEPGGDGTGMPVLTRGHRVNFVFTSDDGQFSLIELEDGTAGWVPSYAVLVHETDS